VLASIIADTAAASSPIGVAATWHVYHDQDLIYGTENVDIPILLAMACESCGPHCPPEQF
jgi:hypothetical protein